jgi:hypothetical protein
MRNQRSVWTIPTTQFTEAHFAVFPHQLIISPIRSSCPEKVCSRCKLPVMTIYGIKSVDTEGWGPQKKNRLEGMFSPDSLIREGKGRAGTSSVNDIQEVMCTCNAAFEKGVILDPFMGSGTTAIMARALNRDWVGVELSEKYVEMTYRRLNE